MKKLLLPFAAFIAGIMIACGGNSPITNPTPNTPSNPQSAALGTRSTSIPGVGTHVSIGSTKAQNKGFDWSLIPTANAQTTSPTLVVTGPSNGYCSGTPADSGTTAATFSYPVYGAGEVIDPGCQRVVFNDIAGNIANSTDGIDIDGDGTLQGFRIRVGLGFGGGITAQVWVQRAGQAIQTPITCSIPANTVSQSQKCTDTTNTFPVLEDDRVVVVLSGSAGDSYHDIKWLLGKN